MKYCSLLTVLVTLILTFKVDCNEKKDSIIHTSTPKVSIWEAAFKGKIEAVKKHLEQGVDIGSKDQVFDGTPLHHAAYGGKNDVALFLIKKGADINAIGGPKGFPAMETPLDVATRQSQNQTISLLRKYGAKTVEELKTKVNDPAHSLTDNIVGKLITLFLSERIRPQMRFNANGVMLVAGQGDNLEDQGLTYKIKGNDVLIFKDGEREAELLFSSSNPKRGDKVEMRSRDDKQKLMIIKIEAANEIINDPVRLTQQEVDPAISVEQAEALLAQSLGQWEGSGVIKGADGEVLAEIPLVSTVRWLEEGDEGFRKNGKDSGESKVQQMRITEKLPQGDNDTVLTRWYDSRKGLFLLTRRLPGEEVPVDPGAEETYEADTETYLGIVRKGIPPGTSFTWTSQMTSEKWIYRGRFLENGKLEWTRLDTQKPVKAEPVDSLEEAEK